jgi:hypothetical protein
VRGFCAAARVRRARQSSCCQSSCCPGGPSAGGCQRKPAGRAARSVTSQADGDTHCPGDIAVHATRVIQPSRGADRHRVRARVCSADQRITQSWGVKSAVCATHKRDRCGARTGGVTCFADRRASATRDVRVEARGVVIGGRVPASANVGAQAEVRCPHPKQSLLVSLLTSPPPEMRLCTVARGCSRAAAVATLKSESALARPSSVQITVPLT